MSKSHETEFSVDRPPRKAVRERGTRASGNRLRSGRSSRHAWVLLHWALRRPVLKITFVTLFALVVLTHHFQELVARAIWLPRDWRGPGVFLGYMFFIYAFSLFHPHPDHEVHGKRRGKKWNKTVKASTLFAAGLLFYCGHMYLRYVCVIPMVVARESARVEPEPAAHAEPPSTGHGAGGEGHADASGGHGAQPRRAAVPTADESIYVPFPMPPELAQAINERGGLPEVTSYEPEWLSDETLKYRPQLARTSMLFVLDFVLIAFFIGGALTVTYTSTEGLHTVFGTLTNSHGA